MKLFANLLLTASVILGSLAASTAYIAPLSMPDEDLVGLTLNAHAGRRETPEGDFEPVAAKNTVLTVEILDALRTTTFLAKNQERPEQFVTVKEFEYRRWIGRWAFLASLAGLLAAAYMIRSAATSQLAAAAASPDRSVATGEESLDAIINIVNLLRRDLPALPDDEARLDTIMNHLGAIQRSHAPAFIDARPRLVNRMGLGRYAGLMDSFAAGERQINRAWSTAADGFYEESLGSLTAAAALLAEAREMLAHAETTPRAGSATMP